MANLSQRSEQPLNTRKEKNDFLDDKWRDTMRDWLACQQTEQGERVQATRSLFGNPVTIIDPHTHSDHSDGRSTIPQNRDAGFRAGIDIVFATDHNSLTQKRAVKNIPSMSWGQEPKTLHHHIGLLGNTRRLETRRDRVDLDMERARKQAPFCWIPHPAGWFTKDYTDEQKDELWKLAPAFAMEVINGAKRIGRAFERHDAEAVILWDRLLTDGIRVTPLGGSDAHIPEGIGSCWTGVPGAELKVDEVIDRLNAGNCLASEGPLLSLHVEGREMGSRLAISERKPLRLTWRVADAAGLQSLRVVADGKAVRTLYPRDKTLVEDEWQLTFSGQRYVRLEARACDDRRAFSAPVYFDLEKCG